MVENDKLKRELESAKQDGDGNVRKDMDEIKSSITSSISNFDPKLYELIDEESTSSLEASFAEPKIIKIKSPSESEISNKIGKFLFKYHSYYLLLSNNGNQLYTTK